MKVLLFARVGVVEETFIEYPDRQEFLMSFHANCSCDRISASLRICAVLPQRIPPSMLNTCARTAATYVPEHGDDDGFHFFTGPFSRREHRNQLTCSVCRTLNILHKR